MKKRILIPFLSVLATSGVLGVAPEASSNTAPAIAGHAWVAGDQSCFTSGWSQVNNTCPTTRKFLVPVTLTFTGSTKFYATGQFASPTTIGAWPSCFAIVNSLTNGQVDVTPTKTLTHAGSQTLLGTLSVSSTSYTAHYDCNFPGTQSIGFGMTTVQWQL